MPLDICWKTWRKNQHYYNSPFKEVHNYILKCFSCVENTAWCFWKNDGKTMIYLSSFAFCSFATKDLFLLFFRRILCPKVYMVSTKNISVVTFSIMNWSDFFLMENGIFWFRSKNCICRKTCSRYDLLIFRELENVSRK